jgi:hypothetical protein
MMSDSAATLATTTVGETGSAGATIPGASWLAA